MDKENKYYSIIENMVKNHRKYPGYEAILEDIIDDVYAHSEVIMGTIDNEDVIKAYLEKVISTSIITVPKRMHFNSNSNHRIISNIPAQEPVKEEKFAVSPTAEQIETVENKDDLDEDTIEQSVELHEGFVQEIEDDNLDSIMEENLPQQDSFVAEKANVEFVDKMINSISTDAVSETISEVAEFEEPEESITEKSEEEPEIEIFDDDLVNSDESAELDLIDTDAVAEIDSPYENIDFENSQEDYGINEEILELQPSDNPDAVSALETNFKEEQELSDVVDNSIVNDEIIENQTYDEAEGSDDNYELLEDTNNENTTDLNLGVEELESVVSEEPATEYDTTEELILAEEDSSELELSLNDDLNVGEGLVVEEFDTAYDLGSENTQDDNNEEDLFTENIEESNETLIKNENSVSAPVPEYKSIDYSVFNYIPEKNDITVNTDNVSEKLCKLDLESPDLNVLKIFDMKYKKNMTIDNIASELKMEKKDIISVLNSIIEIV